MQQLKRLSNKIKHIHFVGIKGVGMAPLAIIAKEAGIKVTGCDIAEEFITDEPLKKAGINPVVGFSKDHLQNVDLVITTGAHGGFDNPEVQHVRYTGIPVMTQGQAVGEFMKGEIFNRKFLGISVAGSHGKTTSTAMLATVLKEAHLDPSFLVGTGNIPSLSSPGHLGKGEYFVTEADEYANEPKYDQTPKFLYQQPKMIIITNIEFDHPDLFNTLDQIREAFLGFVNLLPKDGVLIANGDDPQIQKLLLGFSGRVITYGTGEKNDFRISRVSQNQEQTFFWVEHKNLTLGEFRLRVPGLHNVLNATAVIITGVELGLSLETIKKTLPFFRGSKRRFEFLGEKKRILFFDDYAHHPTEIKATLKMTRKIFPKRKIICLFQPHTYSRTKALWNEFCHAFSDAWEVVLLDIYPSLREEPDKTINSQKMVLEMNKFHPGVKFLPKIPDVVEYIDKKIARGELKDALIITMGAGDIYKIWTKL